MRLKHENAIRQDTLVILPEYNKDGYLHTVLCNRNGVLKTDMSPSKLIDHNLRYLGSSLRGAIEGAGAILGKGGMNPIIFNKELDMILFPSKSPSKEDCVWFSLQHVVDAISIDKKKTRVNLSNGSTVVVNISKFTFDKKLQRACLLRLRIQSRQKEIEGQQSRIESPYHLFKDGHALNYENGVLQEEA